MDGDKSGLANEAELRDFLSTRIELIEPTLTLLDKEAYIPNSLGTRSFIDLLAKDKNNNFVLVELKRNNAACREAIHEVLKYVEGVKRHLAAKDNEIRVIIASTEWKELLVPFSRFVADTTLSITGVHLVVAPQHLKAVPVSPLLINRGRFIAPWHDLNGYKSRDNLLRGLEEYKKFCQEKGIQDYVLVVMRAPEGFHEFAVEQTKIAMIGMQEQMGIHVDVDEVDRLVGKMERTDYIAYFAMQILDKKQYLSIIQSNKDVYDEALEILEDMDEEEALHTLHDYASSVEPRPHFDHFEIGYPAKFKSKLLDSEGWIIESIIRHGAFERNVLLTDEEIVAELSGETGVTGQRYKNILNVNDKAQMSVAKKEIDDCLSDNPVWQAQVLKVIERVEKEHSGADFEVNIFNPCAGIFTLYLAATRDDGVLYIPNYSIVVPAEDPTQLYFGCLVPEGAVGSFQEIIKKYYDDNIDSLLFTMTWGGYEERDTDILESLGLVYRTFRCDVVGEQRLFYVLDQERWKEIDGFFFPEPLSAFMNGNQALMEEIIHEIGLRWKNGMVLSGEGFNQSG